MAPFSPDAESCKQTLLTAAAFCLLFLLAGWWHNATAGAPAAPSDTMLCEVILENDSPAPESSRLCRDLDKEISCNAVFVVLSHQQYNKLTRFQLDRLPNIIINRSLLVNVAADKDWQSKLQQELQCGTAAPQWNLSIYLSARTSPAGRQEVDISVCNLDKSRSFNGRFAVWLVEKTGQFLDDGPCWFMRSEVAAGNIYELPQDETRGCPMPDHFTLPQDRGAGRFALVAVVFDHFGAVQAVAAQELRPCRE